MRHAAVAVTCALALVSCIRSNLVECGDGRVCPEDTVCEPLHLTCVRPAQTTVCGGLADGQPCDAAGTLGICDLGICLPGCGDGVQDVGEECDDGNFASHDGCSSACLREIRSWSQWQDTWRGRTGHMAAYHAATRALVVFGGQDGAALLDEHWQRDVAGTWTQLAITRPPSRSRAAFAYDSLRHRIVMFGGVDASAQVTNETWEYYDTAWHQVSPSVSPPARTDAAMVFDTVRNQMVLFGGVNTAALNDTWVYNGSTWTLRSSPTLPGERFQHAMAWDDARKRVVLFGGLLAGFFFYADTWEYDGTTWAKITTGVAPSGRGSAAMAYLPARNKIVLFGGGGGSDTWEYGAAGWSPLLGQSAPPPRAGATLTYDADAGTLVLVGGVRASEPPSEDVWQLASDGVWTERSPQLSPSARNSPLVYDEANRRAVVYSGIGSGLPHDAWWFDGQRWLATPTPLTPSTFWHATGYDQTRECVVVFGGSSFPLVEARDDTYEWCVATQTWSTYGGASKPPKRRDAALAYDGTSRRLVLFGGMQGQTRLDDTWEYDGVAWTNTMPALHPVAQRQPRMVHDPVGGRTVLFSEDGTTWAYADRGWTQLETPTSPGARSGVGLVFDPLRRRIVLYGGVDATQTNTDLWELDGTTWERAEIVESGPSRRSQFGFVADRNAHALVLFGGADAVTSYGDTWLLQHRSTTPDEVCTNGTDDDGDRQIDMADPDCN